MPITYAPPQTLMGLWRLEKHRFRSIGTIVAEARAGKLPGIAQDSNGRLIVIDSRAALAAMTRSAA